MYTYISADPADNRGSASEKRGKEMEQEDKKHRKE